jgi:hypothetical protein
LILTPELSKETAREGCDNKLMSRDLENNDGHSAIIEISGVDAMVMDRGCLGISF